MKKGMKCEPPGWASSPNFEVEIATFSILFLDIIQTDEEKKEGKSIQSYFWKKRQLNPW